MADDFTEQLNAVLGNPEAMGQIMSIARALTGDGNAAPPQAPPPQAPPPPPAEPEPLQAAPPALPDDYLELQPDLPRWRALLEL